ncbi:hypothetical protein ZWY2020_025338, partial [Hordeum vulgare]
MADVDDDSGPANSGLIKTEGELYMESLVRVSLQLVTKEFPFEVQLHGSKMLQHLVDYRSGELNSADLLNLKLQLVRHPVETAPMQENPKNIKAIVEYARIIPCLLDPLNKIWTMVEWKDNYVSSVSQLFSDGQFLKMAYHVVKFGEEQLKMSKTEGSGARDLSTVVLLKLILPLLLQLLQCIHALWNEDANCLPEELERAKCLSGVELATILESTDGLYDIDNVEYLHRNKTGALLEGTRHRVYNVVGLCTSVEGVFSELLNSLSATDAFVNGLRSMELRHLGKVIRLVVLWMVDFLGPILTECEYRLHFAWFDLLYHGGTGKPYFYGNLVGPDRQINALKQKLLLAFTRKCRIFLECYQLRNKMWSLFLLLHDCFKRIRMSLFGYFVDDETTMNAIPFCRSLTWLAISDMRVRHSIVKDLLPSLIRRLDNQPPCAIQHLRHKLGSSMRASASKDLEALCEEWYNNFEKGSAGEGKSDACAEKNFTAWLRKKKEDLQVMACSAPKELFEGSGEFEDEFRRYLPDYMDMLQQVDSINDYEEISCFPNMVLEPRFRSPDVQLVHDPTFFLPLDDLLGSIPSLLSPVLSRRRPRSHCYSAILLETCVGGRSRRRRRVRRKWLCVDHNVEASWLVLDEVIDEQLADPLVLQNRGQALIQQKIQFPRDILFLWEPVFHPLIRESHMDLLLRIVDQYTYANEREQCQQVVPDTSDFESHLQPYADVYFESKLKEKKYYFAIEQIHLHKKFDGHLASGVLDGCMDEFRSSKDDFVKDLVQDEMVRMQLSDLHHELIKLSLERRDELVNIQHQVITYSECLRTLIKNEPLKRQLGALVKELEEKGFFNTANNSVDWENKIFSERVDKFNNEVFTGRHLPKYYVIRGIIMIWIISEVIDTSPVCFPLLMTPTMAELRPPPSSSPASIPPTLAHG